MRRLSAFLGTLLLGAAAAALVGVLLFDELPDLPALPELPDLPESSDTAPGPFLRVLLHGSVSGGCPCKGTTEYDDMFYSAQKYTVLLGWDWCDQKCLCRAENAKFDPLATVNGSSAKGLCMLLDGTFAEVSPAGDPFDPEDNIMASSAEMARNLSFWSWDRKPQHRNELSVASYKEGRGRMGRAQKECGMGLTLAEIADCSPPAAIVHVERWKLARQGLW